MRWDKSMVKKMRQTKLYEFGIYCNENERYHIQTTLIEWGLTLAYN